MPGNKRYNFKKILEIVVWIIFGTGTIVLLGAAMYKKDSNRCKAVEITIEGVKNNLFIDKSDVIALLEKMNYGALKMQPINTFDLAGMETNLQSNKWIKSAELYFDNNDVLRIKIMEREPVVRIFTSSGTSFYIDSSIKKLPLSDKFSARLPVFTNFPVKGDSFSKGSNSLLFDIKNIGTYISEDPFWMAQIEQVDITPQQTFEMIPKVGNQVIIFGSAENYAEKFKNLFTFYKNVQSKVGWNKYSSINVSYKNQVVAVKRGAGDIKLDSLKTIQLLKILVANAQKQANDSTNNIQLVQPGEDNVIPLAQPHDEDIINEQPLPGNTILSGSMINTHTQIAAPVIDKHMPQPSISINVNKNSLSQFSNIKLKSIEKPNPSPEKKSALKQIIKKPVADVNKQPKAIMKPKNDY